eukprot:g14100.t1
MPTPQQRDINDDNSPADHHADEAPPRAPPDSGSSTDSFFLVDEGVRMRFHSPTVTSQERHSGQERQTAPGSGRAVVGDGGSSGPGGAAGDDHGGGSRGNSSSNSSSNSISSNEDAVNGITNGDEERWRHPAAMLKGGERLTKVLVSPDERSGLFRDRNNASLRFYRDAVSGPPTDYDVGCMNEEAPVTTTLIRSNPRKMAQVHRVRKETADEEDERARLGGKQAKKGFLRGIQGFFFWGKHSFHRQWDRKHAINHLGEDYMTLTKRGMVEGYADGTRVLKEGGPSWFSCLRRLRDDYELYATNDSIEVKRGGTYVWGSSLKKDR